MSDFMTEQLVKKRATGADALKKAGLIAITAVIGLFTLMMPFLMFVLIIAIALDVFLFGRMNVEFEYAYFSGDITIDKIFNMQSRKRLLSANVKDVYVIAPTGSDELRPYENLKVLNYSSQEPGRKTYTMVLEHKGEKVQVVIEPKEEILKNMKTLAPRKVFI